METLLDACASTVELVAAFDLEVRQLRGVAQMWMREQLSLLLCSS